MWVKYARYLNSIWHEAISASPTSVRMRLNLSLPLAEAKQAGVREAIKMIKKNEIGKYFNPSHALAFAFTMSHEKILTFLH